MTNILNKKNFLTNFFDNEHSYHLSLPKNENNINIIFDVIKHNTKNVLQ